MTNKTNKISRRISSQIPDFIRDEHPLFEKFFEYYYESQEKTGGSYNIINDLLSYSDVDFFRGINVESHVLLENVTSNTKNIVVDSVFGFLDKNGSVLIDDEVIYYEDIKRSPNIVFTPGISVNAYNKKIQQLQSLYFQFDGETTDFDLELEKNPINPPSNNHIQVRLYNEYLNPGVDFNIQNNKIVFTEAPRQPQVGDSSDSFQIDFLRGFVLDQITKINDISSQFDGEKRIFDLVVPGEVVGTTTSYYPVNEIMMYVVVNGEKLEPLTDFSIFNNRIIFNQAPAPSASCFITSIDTSLFDSAKFPTAITKVNDEGSIESVIIEDGGSGFTIENTPSITIQSDEGENSTAIAYVNGVKNINLIYGGVGYSTTSPPKVLISEPEDPNGIRATAYATVSESGQVDKVILTSSGSGYITTPRLQFINPGGAQIGLVTISNGSIEQISLEFNGSGYSVPPEVFIDDPLDEDGVKADLRAVLNASGQVEYISILDPGQGYSAQTPPRIKIIDPVGAQVLDVNVDSEGRLVGVDLLTGGSGYEDAPSIYIVDDRKDANGNNIGGVGAKVQASIFNGVIIDINVIDFGSGYSQEFPPSIYISKPPSAKASVEVGIGEVTGVKIIEAGKGYQKSQLVNCSRGVSGVKSYDYRGNSIFQKEGPSRSTNHTTGSKVVSLDNLFFKQILKKYVDTYLPFLGSVDYTSINLSQVIKTIKEFYSSKGTKKAISYLFKLLFNVNIEVNYPKEQIIKPSDSVWTVDTVIRTKLLDGNPEYLRDGFLQQFKDEVDSNVDNASVLIENYIAIKVGDTDIYELTLSEETLTGKFTVPYKTKLAEKVSQTDSIITVDSTIGWPDKNGVIILGNEKITYKEKTLNQFIECTRATDNTNSTWDSGTLVYSDIIIYANYGTPQQVTLQILGIVEAKSTELLDTGSYYQSGDKLTASKLGATSDDYKLISWIYNVKKLIVIDGVTYGGTNNRTATVTCNVPHGLLIGDKVTIYGANPNLYNGTFFVTSRPSSTVFSYELPQPASQNPVGNIVISVELNKGKGNTSAINNSIKSYTTNVQNTYFNDKYVYVASSGIPNFAVGPFSGTALVPGNQRHLKRFPFNPSTISVKTENKQGSNGLFVNGVPSYSYKSNEFIEYGPVTSVAIVDPGSSYDAASPPNIEFTGGGGTGATGEVVVNGSVFEIEVLSGGSGYTTQPLVSIVGNGFGAAAASVITNGVVSKILVTNPGEGYTSEPTISIVGGGGSGATAKASVRGPIQSITITNGGTDYTASPEVVLSSGRSAEAYPIISNGRILSIAIINAGFGFTSAPKVSIYGDGFGAIAKATIATEGEDKGRVTSIEIINRGIGYTQGKTSVRLDPIGSGAKFESKIFNWDVNLVGSTTLDLAKGFVFSGLNNQYGGEYAHISNPQTLRYVLGDNLYRNPEGVIKEKESGLVHSPIIGWAFDGHPIYGPYAHSDATSLQSSIVRMKSSYTLKSNLVYDSVLNPSPVRIDGPSLEEYPAGYFIQDYDFIFTSTNDYLDQYNGRFAKTPEFPNGVYAYYITIDASDDGNPVYPYIIGPNYNSVPDKWNREKSAIQSSLPSPTNRLITYGDQSEEKLDLVVRYRDPFEDVDIDVERTPNESSSSLLTEDGDFLVFELEDSDQSGFIDLTYKTQAISSQFQFDDEIWNESQDTNGNGYIIGKLTNVSLSDSTIKIRYYSHTKGEFDYQTSYEIGDIIYAGGDGFNTGRLYKAVTSGTSGDIVPSHISGELEVDGITWEFLSAVGTIQPFGTITNGVVTLVTIGLIETNTTDQTFIYEEEDKLEVFDYFPSINLESKVDIEIETTTKFESAQVDSFVLENRGVNYKVNDRVEFDNEGTGGYGASARIDSVQGKKINSYTFEYDFETGDVNGLVVCNEPHELEVGDFVNIKTSPIMGNTNKNFKLKTINGIGKIEITQVGTGYNENFPPVVTIQGDKSGSKLEAVLDITGVTNEIKVINSGNGFTESNPRILISHPQIPQKANYFISKLSNTNEVIINDITTNGQNKNYYICGKITDSSNNTSAFITKVQQDGINIWTKSLTPTSPVGASKYAEFNKLYVKGNSIYAIGVTRPNPAGSNNFNPDVIVAKYNQNTTGNLATLEWQKQLAGISGTTRSDYGTAICVDENDYIHIAGYTNTNSTYPFDAWIAVIASNGELVNKRKISSSTKSEKINTLLCYEDKIYFVGDCVTSSNLESVLVGRYSLNDQFINLEGVKTLQTNTSSYGLTGNNGCVDEYGELIISSSYKNSSTGESSKILLSKISYIDSTLNVIWAKNIENTLLDDVTMASSSKISVDIFGDIHVGLKLESADRVDTFAIKCNYNGELLHSTTLDVLDNTLSAKYPIIAIDPSSIHGDVSSDAVIAGNGIYNENTVALYHFEGSDGDTTTDDSSFNSRNNFTFEGSSEITTNRSKFGISSLSLPNTSSCVRLPGGNLPNLYSYGQYTIEGWFYRQASSSNDQTLFSLANPSNGQGFAVTANPTTSALNLLLSTENIKSISVVNALLSTSQKKFGTASLHLDNVGDYIQVTDPTQFDFTDYTIEAWVYLPSLPSTTYSMVAATTGVNYYWAIRNISGTLYLTSYDGAVHEQIAGTTLQTSTWAHVAWSRTGSTLKTYLNGVQVHSDTSTGTPDASGITIGYSLSYPGTHSFNGYIDEVRISSVGRYNSNFTPKTSEFNPDSRTNLLLHFNGSNGSANIVDSSASTQIVSSASNKIPVNTWTHIALVKNSTNYALYASGTKVAEITSAASQDTSNGDLVIGNHKEFQPETNFVGNIDEFRISSIYRYSGLSYTTPSQAFTSGSFDVNTGVILKLDKDRSEERVGSFVNTNTNLNINVLETVENYNVSSYANIAASAFVFGSEGSQVLDFNETFTTNTQDAASLTYIKDEWSTRTSTIPSGGKKLKAETSTIKKFYIKQSTVSKIDNIKELTLNQAAKFTINSRLYVKNLSGSVVGSAKIIANSPNTGKTTIADVTGTINEGSSYRLSTDANDINEIYAYIFTEVDATTPGTFDFTIPVEIEGTFKQHADEDYSIRIDETIEGSPYIRGSLINITANQITFNSDYSEATITGLTAVTKITLITNLTKILYATDTNRTEGVFVRTNSWHNLYEGEILYISGNQTNSEYNGSFNVSSVLNIREFIYQLPKSATTDPNQTASQVEIYSRSPSLRLLYGHQYLFDTSDPSNQGYYLSFSRDNLNKIEYSFNNIEKKGVPGFDVPGLSPYNIFKVTEDVSNISFYFDPSHIGEDSPVDPGTYMDVRRTPYTGKYSIYAVYGGTIQSGPTSFKIKLTSEPEGPAVAESTLYSTTSIKASGPIESIRLINKGGFYKKLPKISGIVSSRVIERAKIIETGTEYAGGEYFGIPILGDGEGGKIKLTVDGQSDPPGQIVEAVITDPGKGYTTAYIDINSVPGILGPNLQGGGAEIEIIIPPYGTGASLFPKGSQIGKIKKLKNNNFGVDYSHDYTLRPEITFPINLQLINANILSSIKVTNPGSGYTSIPAVVITGGGGSGAVAEAIVKNGRISDIIVKDPGTGYSTPPDIELKSSFNYVVNLDLNYFQFAYPHGIANGSVVTLRADDNGAEEGELPIASFGRLSSTQNYYAVAGVENALEPSQIRIALTPEAAAIGDYINIVNAGSGRQVILTASFGGEAEAIVETSKFLKGEYVFQGSSFASATAFGYVSNNDGWQSGPRMLKLIDYTGEFVEGEKVTGIVSKASGTISNINEARGVLNIGSLTTTPGRFLDDVGKPSEIIQKIQDSYYYQNFSYSVKSPVSIEKWRSAIKKNTHPAGFEVFGELDIQDSQSIVRDAPKFEFTRGVNLSESSNVNVVSNFALIEPIYSEFDNTQVLFRSKRLTSSETILTSFVKRLDDISSQFDGIKNSFTLTVNNEPIAANTNQSLILINGIVQSPDVSYSIAGNQIIFSEPPQPPASIKYVSLDLDFVDSYTMTLSNVSGSVPDISGTIRGLSSNATAKVISSTLNTMRIYAITGEFEIGEVIISPTTGLGAILQSLDEFSIQNIYQFGESITNTTKDTVIVEEPNIEKVDDNTIVTNSIVVSKYSGTANSDGVFDLEVGDYILSAKTQILSQITGIQTYRDPVTNDAVETLIINSGSTFNGLIFSRISVPENPNTIVDDISKTRAFIEDIDNLGSSVSNKFENYESINSVLVKITDKTGEFDSNDILQNINLYYNNEIGTFVDGETAEVRRLIYKNSSGTFIPGNEVTGFTSKATAEIIGVNYALKTIYLGNINGTFQEDELLQSYNTNISWVGNNSYLLENRFLDAADLLEDNKNFIAAESVGFIEATTSIESNPDYDPTICFRDLGYIIDAVIHNLRCGGNDTSIEAALAYYDGTNLQHINGEVTETIAAINKAKALSLKVIDNVLETTLYQSTYTQVRNLTLTVDPITGSNTDPASCQNVLSAINVLYTIITDIIDQGPTAAPTLTGATGCVQATAYMHQYYIDEFTIDQVDTTEKIMYFDKIGDATRHRYRDAANSLRKNFRYIVEETAGRLKAEYPTLIIPNDSEISTAGTDRCKTDLSLILQGLISDLENGGNYNTLISVRSYLDLNNKIKYINGQLLMSIYAHQQLGILANQAIAGTLSESPLYTDFIPVKSYGVTIDAGLNPCQDVQDDLTSLINTLNDSLSPTGQRFRDASNLIWTNKTQIASEAVAKVKNYFTYVVNGATFNGLTFPGGTEGEAKCRRDVGYILDAIIMDLLTGGTGYTIEAVKYYIDNTNQVAFIKDQLLASILTFEFAIDIAKQVVNNQIITGLYSGVTFVLDNTITFVSGGCTDVVSALDVYKQTISNVFGSTGSNYRLAAKLVLFNKSYIQNESYQVMKNTYPSFNVPGGVDGINKCKRDIGYLVDAAIYDLITGGNSGAYAAASSYLDTEGNLTFVETELTETLYAFNLARTYAKDAVSQILTSPSPAAGQYTYTDASITLSGGTLTAIRNKIDESFDIITNTLTDPESLQLVNYSTGIVVPSYNYGPRDFVASIRAGLNSNDYAYGLTSNAHAEITQVVTNRASFKFKFFELYLGVNPEDTQLYQFGETFTTNNGATGRIIYIEKTENDYIVKVTLTSGTLDIGDLLLGDDSEYESDIETISEWIQVNDLQGSFTENKPVYGLRSSEMASVVEFVNKNSAIISTTGGRLEIDTETITEDYKTNDIIYPLESEYFAEISSYDGEFIDLNDYILFEGSFYIDVENSIGNIEDSNLRAGLKIELVETGTNIPQPLWGYINNVEELDSTHIRIYLYNVTTTTNLSFVNGDRVAFFATTDPDPTYAGTISDVYTSTNKATAKVSKITEISTGYRLTLTDISGVVDNYSRIKGKNSFRSGIFEFIEKTASIVKYSRGFDGVQTQFDLTYNNGVPYYPDQDGHVLVFVNGILQPVGVSYSTFSDKILFTEPPTASSGFVGFYVGKLRALDDLSFEFDSLKNSFNLKLNGVFYSLTLTPGVQSNVISAANNIIVSLNGVIQEPGIGFNLIGSRIIFSEVPRAGSTCVAYSYVGSEADVVASRVVPPIEVGDTIKVESENSSREVAIIESSNSLITYEYTDAIFGKDAQALATITKGQIYTANVTNGGNGYTARPNVRVDSASGFDAVLKALVGVSRVEISDYGSGYSYPDVLVQILNQSEQNITYNPENLFTIDEQTYADLQPGNRLRIISNNNPDPADFGIFPNINNKNIIENQQYDHRIIWRGGFDIKSTIPTRVALSELGISINGTPLIGPSSGKQVDKFTLNSVDNEEINGYDICGGAPNINGVYSYHSAKFLYTCWDDISTINNDGHSKIIGISYDGYPIYGPFGYSDPNDTNSNVTRMTPSWRIKQTLDEGRPDVQIYPPGKFIEDFEFVDGLGSLDRYNGRYCKTPEYPNGTYAYFVTLNSNNTPVYPYIIGPEFYGEPILIGEEVDDYDVNNQGQGAEFEIIFNEIFGVDEIKILNKGNNYDDFNPPSIEIINCGVPSIRPRFSTVVRDGKIVDIQIIEKGSGFDPLRVEIVSEVGTGAKFRPEIINGEIRSIVVSSNGDGYFTPATINVLGGEGSGCIAVPVTQSVTGISVLNPGRSYLDDPLVVIFGGGGDGAEAVALTETRGTVTSITVTNGGQFYSTPPYILLEGGGGAGAKAKAIVTDGQISEIIVTDPGYGYSTEPNVIFTRLVNVRRTQRNRQIYNSGLYNLTGLITNVGRTDSSINVESTSDFPGSGNLVMGREIINYSAKTANKFIGLTRGTNFRYDQRVILDNLQDINGVSQYKFRVGDRVVRIPESSTNKAAYVYDWYPETRELFVVFKVDELAFIDGGRANEKTTIVQFDAGIAESTSPAQFPHVIESTSSPSDLIYQLSSNITTIPYSKFQDKYIGPVTPESTITIGGDGIADLYNVDTDYELEVNLDGGTPFSLYGIEETTGGQNTTLFQNGDKVKDGSTQTLQASVQSAGGLDEGIEHAPTLTLTLDPQFSNQLSFTIGETITGTSSNITAIVKSWNSQTNKLVVGDIVPYDTEDPDLGIYYTFSKDSSIVEIRVIDGGNGFTSTPTVIIEDIGKEPAAASVTLNADRIDTISILDTGYGYSSTPEITFSGGEGVDAVAEAIRGPERIQGSTSGALWRIKSISYDFGIRNTDYTL